MLTDESFIKLPGGKDFLDILLSETDCVGTTFSRPDN